MRLIRDAEVRDLIDPAVAERAVAGAFAEAAAGRTALQLRQRIEAGGSKLSTMAAILPSAGVAGAKIYTTIGGRFSFVVLLFDVATGAPLACMEADAFTELRTAAVTTVAAVAFAKADARRLAIFGTGVQARAHVRALAPRFPHLREIAVVSRSDAQAFCTDVETLTGLRTFQAKARIAMQGADIAVTATRAETPLVSGEDMGPETFLAAVGSTLPWTRELAGDVFGLADRILVEDLEQSFNEAGDLRIAEAEGQLDRTQVETLAASLALKRRSHGVVVFKSVGIALTDVALAAEVWRALNA